MGKTKAEPRKKADAKLSVKKGAEVKKPRKTKAAKDPNKPKRPPSAFFVFMEGFRKQFKEQNPNNKLVSVVGKAGGEKWKSMSDSDKAPFVAKAAKFKTEYTKNMASYNKGEVYAGANKSAEDGDSDKSKSEVHDEEDGSDEDEGDDE